MEDKAEESPAKEEQDPEAAEDADFADEFDAEGGTKEDWWQLNMEMESKRFQEFIWLLN